MTWGTLRSSSISIYPQSGPLAGPPLAQALVTQGQALNQAFKVEPGLYYVVFDNTPTAGVAMAPAHTPAGLASPLSLLAPDVPAVVSYAVQIGDAP